MKDTLKTEIDGIIFTAVHYAPQAQSQHTVLFCLPGGGASAAFFDLAPDYSFVRRMTVRGYDVITMDHPGTANNPLPEDHEFLTPRKSADFMAQALTDFLAQCAAKESRIIGIGHSMGGMLVTLMQARHKPFKAIGLFGSSAGGLDWGLTEEEKAYIEKPDGFERDIEKLTLAKFGAEFIKTSSGPSGKSITFGGETPELTQRLRDIGCELYAAGGMMSMTRGSFRKEVNAINVPIFFAFGDHDIGIPPEDAPKDYINAPSRELIVLEDTGHNHFAFSSIATLCTKLDKWAQEGKL